MKSRSPCAWLLGSLGALLLCLVAGSSAAPMGSKTSPPAMKITITIGERTLSASVADNATARDFASMLPLRLTLRDYGDAEKISDLSRQLSTAEAPSAHKPEAGHIAYYAPWGNLAIFHRDFANSPGLINMGVIEGNLDALKASGPLQATIRIAE